MERSRLPLQAVGASCYGRAGYVATRSGRKDTHNWRIRC
jgi:hypothetical protein